MSTRLKGFTVALEKEMRDDDSEAIKEAIMMIRGVCAVKQIESNSDDWINRSQIRMELSKKLWEALEEKQ